MRIERITFSNFRCFGPAPVSIDLAESLTTFIGPNGSGKTAVLQGLSRLFGVTSEQRRVRRQDFHVPTGGEPSVQRDFWIEVLFRFPELTAATTRAIPPQSAIPEFFHQMAVGEDRDLRCRLRFDANWIDDGSAEGAIDTRFRIIRTLEPAFEESDCSSITAADRTRIQMIYIPSVRDGESQVASFLRGRLWRAVSWSDEFRGSVVTTGAEINRAFSLERGVTTLESALRQRWDSLAAAGIDGTPQFSPVDQRFDEFIRHVEVRFLPGVGRPLDLNELSEGQRSLFHIALTLGALDVEALLRKQEAEGFIEDHGTIPILTLIALEEPENHLAPFFLSRIVSALQQATAAGRDAQGIVASHSASLLSRVTPDDVRHFKLAHPARVTEVRSIALPATQDEAGKFVREAVRSYPELYFARFVVLGEGASEAIVIPRIAETFDVHIDRSFVAVVPLGGRHVNHFWKLLTDLGIPHATLLDLDAGRAGGGWGRIKAVLEQLLANGHDASLLLGDLPAGEGIEEVLHRLARQELDPSLIAEWLRHLQDFGVFFCSPLDLDMLMLKALPDLYKTVPAGLRGPQLSADSEEAEIAVLGAGRESAPYGETTKALFPWYRYLFLGRSKPDTHIRALSQADDTVLREATPPVLQKLIARIRTELNGPSVLNDEDAQD